MKTSSIDLAKKYLSSKKGLWPEIEKSTGIKTQWISRLLRGVYQDPGVRKIDAILEYANSEGWKAETETE